MMSDDVNDEDGPQHRELRPLLFSNSVWVLKRPTVRRDLRFADVITKTALSPHLF